MVTREQYAWLIRIQEGGCTLSHRDRFPDLFVELTKQGLITYQGPYYRITEKGKLELQESKRSWNSDTKANLALILSGISLGVSVIGLVLGLVLP